MKCQKCGILIKESDTFCPKCGTRSPSRFNQKIEKEKQQKDKMQKIKDKGMERNNRIVKEKNLQNPYIIPSFVCGLIATIIILAPTGHEIQMKWWYSFSVIILGGIGYALNLKASNVNKEFHTKYRVTVNPTLTKIALYVCSFATFAGVIVFTIIIMTLF